MNKQEILDIIEKHAFIDFATINQIEFPEIRAVVNLRHKDIAPHLQSYFKNSDKIYIMTNTSSAKISQVENNSKSCIYFTNDELFLGLLVMGNINEVKDEKIKEELWDDSWEIYYKGGLHGGDYSLLEFVPNIYKYYNGNEVIADHIKW